MKKIIAYLILFFFLNILFAQNNRTSIQEVFDCKTANNLKIKYGAVNVIYDAKNSNYNKIFLYPDTKNQLNIYLKNGTINNIEIAFPNGKWYKPTNSENSDNVSGNALPNTSELINCNMYVAYINNIDNSQYLIMPITQKNKPYYGLGYKIWNTNKGFYILPTKSELKTAGPYKTFKLVADACLSFQHDGFLVLDEFTPANATYYNRYMNNYKFKIGEPLKGSMGELWTYACSTEIQVQKSEYTYQNSKNVNPNEFKRADQTAILDAAMKDLAKHGSVSNVPNTKSSENNTTTETIDSPKAKDEIEQENTEVENDTIYAKADVMPSFPGGVTELMKFIQNNTHYPSLARENGLEGKVIVKFYIDTDGTVREPTVLKDGVGGGCGNEAVRVVNSMPKFTPGTSQSGKAIKVYYTLPFTFKKQ